MDKKLFQHLIAKVENGTATDEELAEFNAYMNRLAPGHAPLHHKLEDEDVVRDDMWAKIQASITPAKAPKINWYRPLGIAACLLVGISVGIHFLVSNRGTKMRWHAQVDHDITPVGNSAVLTLAGGKKIVLTDNINGVIAVQKNAIIHQSAGGQITYSNAKDSNGAIAFDTLTTPAGGVYNLRMADGTMVWLNAATSLRFPERFEEGKRAIQLLRGEAYFEVAHQANAPFSVLTPKGLVEDIGTHFNISAYPDDPTESTTLLEGSVRVTNKHSQQVKLLPGQQGQLSYSTIKPLMVDKAGLDEIMAWKNGLFLFDNEKLSSIMQKLSRWYNVKITYQNEAVKNEVFFGSVSRFKNFSEVIEMLERTGNSHFELKDNVILIKPKQ